MVALGFVLRFSDPKDESAQKKCQNKSFQSIIIIYYNLSFMFYKDSSGRGEAQSAFLQSLYIYQNSVKIYPSHY